jgi:molybdopterin-synthase adenylyltransferase
MSSYAVAQSQHRIHSAREGTGGFVHMIDRYHRQSLLPQIGPAGQAKLAAARVLIVGCGALGTTIAEQLVRAGVGFMRIVDRDLVELTNLQRQVLFEEADADEGTPKAIAAARRLAAVNSSVTVEPIVADVHAGNAQELAIPDFKSEISNSRFHADLILDGTDNAETRYLLNDVSVKHGIPWIYGACVGVEGRVMAIHTAAGTACLRCIFLDPPGPAELPTCDTAGVLGPAAAAVGAIQAALAIQILVGHDVPKQLVRLDLWRGRFGATDIADARRADCPACGRRQFEFLDAPIGSGSTTTLCGRNAVQVRPASGVGTRLDLQLLAKRVGSVANVQQTRYLLKCQLLENQAISLTVFPDGRAIVHGTNDTVQARSLYAKYVGA